ncbi:hypothetical protein B0T22DRAFT_221729 [Podospora appendiculata]|uniref:GDP/GTP exchange factor Sec2 N-terminal domain-containing protein n=1 Tax=Podospora appendiculata TaxID=314037 RepID=A0AAE0X5M0_9PEZI|nr:hypothetical protein B0T22DRAFT_221729 [Podospora appendiculata]
MTLTASPAAGAPLCCPRCGFDLHLPADEGPQAAALLKAQNTIADLQAQVRLLNQKASAAVDRWADYEDELAALRATTAAAAPQTPPQSLASPTSTTTTTPRTTASSFLPAAAATRLSAFLSPHKTAPAPLAGLKPHPTARSGSAPSPRPSPLLSPPPPPPPPPPPLTSPTPTTATTEDLLEALSREQALRLDAEHRLSETSREVEDLSVTLFEQANEMVVTERRARAALEERVETLEKREGEKKRRLARLEGAMERIERVRRLLGPQAGGGGLEEVGRGAREEVGGKEAAAGIKLGLSPESS